MKVKQTPLAGSVEMLCENILTEIAPSSANGSPSDDELDHRQDGKRIRRGFAVMLLAALLCLYHAQHTYADPIVGSTSDENITVQWEYDLEQGTGMLFLINFDLSLWWDEAIFFDDLLPIGATNIQYAPEMITIDESCPGAPASPRIIAKLPPMQGAVITFEHTSPNLSLVVADAGYGVGGLGLSACACLLTPPPSMFLDDFLAVQAVEYADCDGDGIINPLDICPDTAPGTLVDSEGRPRADFNGDCQVDEADTQIILNQLLDR